MVLVDTSVWISLLNNENNRSVEKFKFILANGIVFGLNHLIYLELLNGSKSIDKYYRMKEYLDAMKFFDLKFGRESYAKASLLYLNCRKSGITVRSTIDILIAQTAIENDLYLLHNDRDFEFVGQVVKELKFY